MRRPTVAAQGARLMQCMWCEGGRPTGGCRRAARHKKGGAEIARPDKTATYRKGGHRETCFIVRVEAQYKLIFAAGTII